MATTFADFGRSIRPQGASVAKRWRQAVILWVTRRRERLALAELDDRLLRDIGVDRLMALHEAGRPFWDGGERPSGRRSGWRA